jgi:hypothetical protein
MSSFVKYGIPFLAAISFELLTCPPTFADHDRKNPPCAAVVFLVNGFTGCCIPEKIKTFLVEEKKEVCVHVSNWNHIDQKGHPGVPLKDGTWKITPSPPTDEGFVNDMRKTIKDDIDPSTPLILIGHSFGGDAVLQVAKRIEGRKIAFLAVLDGVGKGGLRKNITKPVPDNVEYFFNRWQQNPGTIASTGDDPTPEIHWIPLDRLLSGKIKSHAAESNQKKQNAEKTKTCKTKYRDPANAIPNLLTHGGVPNDSCIQAKVRKILLERVLH